MKYICFINATYFKNIIEIRDTLIEFLGKDYSVIIISELPEIVKFIEVPNDKSN